MPMKQTVPRSPGYFVQKSTTIQNSTNLSLKWLLEDWRLRLTEGHIEAKGEMLTVHLLVVCLSLYYWITLLIHYYHGKSFKLFVLHFAFGSLATQEELNVMETTWSPYFLNILKKMAEIPVI